MIRAPDYRSWRFQFPRDEPPRPGEEPPSPGLGVGATGAIATVGDEAAIRQAILLLLSTSTGERVMRPDYGCELRKLVFWPNDNTTAGLAIHYVRRALERWEPRVDVLRVDASRQLSGADGSTNSGGDDGDRLYVFVEYRVRATRQTDRLAVAVNLAGGGVTGASAAGGV